MCLFPLLVSQFDKALDLACKYDFLSTEKAYCLYRQKQDDEALKLLDAAELETQTSAQLHLAAQLASRLTRWKEQERRLALTDVCYSEQHLRSGNYDQSIRVYELLLARAQEVSRK